MRLAATPALQEQLGRGHIRSRCDADEIGWMRASLRKQATTSARGEAMASARDKVLERTPPHPSPQQAEAPAKCVRTAPRRSEEFYTFGRRSRHFAVSFTN